jgi:hypothetical protein
MGKNVAKTLGWIDLPESKSGKFRIEHRITKKGASMCVRNSRESVFGGGKPSHTIAPHDIRLHYLVEDGEATWASDHPQEIDSQRQCIKDFHGDVLIGGLGVGLILALLRRDAPGVDSVTVIEKSPEVIELVWEKVMDRRCTVIQDDLFTFLRMCKAGKRTFDNAYYDIWCPNGEDVLFTHVRPLRKLSKGVVTGRVTCWQEDVMTGQLRMELVTMLQIPDMNPAVKMSDAEFEQHFSRWNRTRMPFWRWYRKTKPSTKVAMAAADFYSHDYAFSTPAWRKVFGKFEKGETK